MTDEVLPESVLASADTLVRAASEFLREALPHAPQGVIGDLASCSEVIVSIRSVPAPALCVSGRNERGLVKWDIELQTPPREMN